MKIPSSIIKEYLLTKFTDYHVSHDEFLVKSLFYNDRKKHMSINTETGLWQCFRTKEHGNFLQLVALCEDVHYSDAYKIIGSKLFDCPEKLFDDSIPPQKELYNCNNIIDEACNFKKLIGGIDTSSVSECLAIKFLYKRKLPLNKFYFGNTGKYANRLIIPYEDKDGLFFFQARQLINNGMKYLNPASKDCGVKSSDILYPFNKLDTYVVVTEGPLDAITLQHIGINATCTQGSSLSRSQLKELKDSKLNIIISYDNDEAGMYGTEKTLQQMINSHMKTPYVVKPPKKFKDWSDFYVASNKKHVTKHINKNVRKLDFFYRINELLG